MNADYGARKLDPFMGLKVAGIKSKLNTMPPVSSARKRIQMAQNHSSWRAVWLLSVMLGLLPLLWVPVSQGQTTSITSSGLNTNVALSLGAPVPTYNITGGTRPGNGTNLFHSFGDFSVGTLDRAVFQNDSGLSTTNILSRVTGGQTSNIYGAIQTAGFGTAALWLINPAGIVFGPSASLNVGGSVHFSTADYLRLGSGNDRFYADLGKTSQLTSAAVTAFGFLNSNPAAITVKGRTLEVPNGQTLSLIGGRGTFIEETTRNLPLGVTLSAPGGHINIARVSQPLDSTLGGEVRLNVAGTSPGLTSTGLGSGSGIITLDGVNVLGQGASITTSVDRTPAVLIRGGQLMMDGGGVLALDSRGQIVMDSGANFSTTSGSNIARDIEIAANSVTLQNNAKIQTEPSSTTAAGSITLNTNQLTMAKANIWSFTLGSGTAGPITIQGLAGPGSPATSVNLTDSLIQTTMYGGSSTTPPAAITITAKQVDLKNTFVRADTVSDAPAGNITFNLGSLNMNNFSGLTSLSYADFGTSANNAGNAGTITIQGLAGPGSRANSVNFDGSQMISEIRGGNASTRPATISITADDISLVRGSFIEADTKAGAPAGNIILNVGTLTAGTSTISSASTLANSTAGHAGAISIQGLTGVGSTAAHVGLDNSTISTTISGGSPVTVPAAIDLAAEVIRLANGSRITADTSGEASAGNIHLDTADFAASNGAMISSNSTKADGPAGGAGKILINGPATNISLDNSSISTTISGGNEFLIDSGAIHLTAQAIRLANGARITADTSGDTSAGSIILNVSNLATSGGAMVSSSTTSTGASAGSAGELVIQGAQGERSFAESITLDDSIFSITSKGGDPGHISILGRSISLESGTRIDADTSGGGLGGNILFQGSGAGIGSIATTNFAASNGVRISTNSTGTADAGNVSVVSGNIFIRDSTVSTSATQASGGDITLNAPNMVRLVGANLTSSVNGSANSNGGNITIDTAHPQFVIMQGNSQILAKANEGQGGAITIIGGVVLQELGSVLDATAGPAGISGSINIQAPFQQLSGAIAPLPQAFAVATNLYGQRCAAEKGGQFSSFVQGSRDGLPPQPGDLIPSPLRLDFDETAAVFVPHHMNDISASSRLNDVQHHNGVLSLQNAGPSSVQLPSFYAAEVSLLSRGCQ